MPFFEKMYKVKILTSKLRFFLLSGNFKTFGKKSTILFPLKIWGSRNICIGSSVFCCEYSWLLLLLEENKDSTLIIEDGTYIGRFAHITVLEEIHIGRNVLIADKVYISDNYHCYENISLPVKKQPVKLKKRVRIGDDSWIGENVCIIGAEVGKHCIIGANSVVLNDIPDYSLAVGSPAKVIKKYNALSKSWEKITGKEGTP